MLRVFQQGQFGRRKVASASAQIGLDAYTTGMWACYGLNKMLTGATQAVRVRRSNDNAEQDIGFSGNSFDSASLSSFVGSNSAFVTTWYDQTGNSRHMLQATSGRQPRIVNAGTPDNAIVFNPSGTDDFFQTSATGSSSVTAKSIFRRYTTRARNSVNINFEYGDGGLIGGGSGANQIQCNDSTGSTDRMIVYLATNSGSSFYQKNHNSDQPTPTSNGVIVKKGTGSATNAVSLYEFGALAAAQSGTGGSITETGNFPAYAWSLGARASSASFGSQISMYSCAIYDADMSASANAINTILDTL